MRRHCVFTLGNDGRPCLLLGKVKPAPRRMETGTGFNTTEAPAS